MMTFKNGCAIAALAVALPMTAVSSGNAAPLAAGTALSAPVAAAASDNSLLTQVQWRGRRGGGWGRGGGAAIGLGAGLLLGGAIAAAAAPRYYGPGPGYGYGYGYGGPTYYQAPAPVVVAPSYGYAGGDDEAYCMQRYRSYDPASGTYLNNDGNRYPCP